LNAPPKNESAPGGTEAAFETTNGKLERHHDAGPAGRSQAPTAGTKFADFKVHPVAAIFPMIPLGSQDWALLTDDIRENGQIEPSVWDGDVLLDGRNRELACERLGKEPKRIQWDRLGMKIPVHDWIFGKNIARRNLTHDQVAAVCGEMNLVMKRLDAEKNQKAAQFKPGNAESAKGGLAKAGKVPVNMDSCSPAAEPERDTKEMHSRSTVGKIAAAAGVSHHKAAQAVALTTAAATNPEAKAALEGVKAGTVKLKDAVKVVKESTQPTQIPSMTRRSPTPFSMSAWKAQTRNLIEMRIESVPPRDRPEVIQFLAQLAQEATP